MSALNGTSEEKMQFINSPNSINELEGDLMSSNQNKKSSTTGPNADKSSTILNMGSTNQAQYVSTLDEPVSVTIMRDMKAVFYKFGHVFFPKKSILLLKDW